MDPKKNRETPVCLPDETLQESVAAVREALRSLEAGERFVPMREFIAQFQQEIAAKRASQG